MSVSGGEAERLVASAYGALDLFAGDSAELRRRANSPSAQTEPGRLAPSWWAPASRAALSQQLAAARVCNGPRIDAYCLARFV